MNNKQPVQRRGLGRGLGSLIPTAPAEQAPARGEENGALAGGVPAQGRHSATPDSNGAVREPGANGQAVATLTEDRPVGVAEAAEGAPVEVAGAYFAELPVGSITPNARQPRQVFEEEAMAELVHSVTEVGLLQPVVVRRTGDSTYELIMGERRWRAMQEAGLETIPAIVRQTDDEAMLRDALLENLHRSQLNPLEEAAAYRQLLDDFGCTHDELAGRIGRSRPQISNTMRLLNLSPAVQRRVAAGVISAGHARALLGVSEPAAQDRLAGRVVSEGISVRGLEELVAVGEHGQDEDDQPKVRPPRPNAPGLAELNDRLSDRLDTRVKVTLGRTKGKIAIEFASLTDLERIVSVIDPRNRDDRPI
jgi:ParB family transcriptional regulator, chromosome partitioning protein